MLPAFDTPDAALMAAWLLVGSFLVRLGWSVGGWVRRRLLKDSEPVPKRARSSERAVGA